jgi:branched-chain amino acid aminotransferase
MTAPQIETWFRGSWLADGRAPILNGDSHGMWLGQLVFDGARAFDGLAPDLDLHCQRVVASARAFGLKPALEPARILELAREGITRFPKGTALYIRPMFWADDGFVAPDPETTDFALVVKEMPMPGDGGFSACLSELRRPTPESAPTMAKAACLYPNSGRALMQARARGFDNAVMRDAIGNVAEFATANLMFARDGKVITPVANGSFLYGITLQRVIDLLRADGVTVEERRVRPEELLEADEIFNTGNYGKVMPVTRYEDRTLQPGPIFRQAKTLYFDWARAQGPAV